MQRVEVEEKEGISVVNTLVEVATPDHHARFHVPDQAGVLADHVMAWIKDAINKDPTAPVGVYITFYNTLLQLKFKYCIIHYMVHRCVF